MKDILEELGHFAAGIDQSQIGEFELLLQQSYAKRTVIVGLGAGRMGYSLRGFIMRLGHLGLHAHMIGDTCVPRIGPDDMVIVNSSSGETPSLLVLVQQAVKAGTQAVYLGCAPTSSIARLSSVHVIYPKINSSQPMKTIYEQGSQLVFDSVARNLELALGLDASRNHSILE